MEQEYSSRYELEGSGVMNLTLIDHQIAEQNCSESNFLKLSTMNLEKMPFQGGDYGVGAPVLGFPSNALAFSYFNGDLMELQRRQMIASSLIDKPLISLDSMNLLKIPKPEPVDEQWPTGNLPSMYGSEYLKLCNSSYYQLPDVQSLEHIVHQEEQKQALFAQNLLIPASKRFKPSDRSPSPTSMMILKNLPLMNLNPNSFISLKPPSSSIPQSVLARQRRKKITERTSCLQKLMPWNKKMDMATMLEEAYKYVKFLQAQVRVLQSMPVVSQVVVPDSTAAGGGGIARGGGGNTSGVFSGLEKLNRQQLLHVLVNSPVAQTILYGQECCVYSLEQIVMLKNMTERKKNLLQQMVLIGSSSQSGQ